MLGLDLVVYLLVPSASALSEISGFGADLNPFGGVDFDFLGVGLGIILDFLGAGFGVGLAANARSFSDIGLRIIWSFGLGGVGTNLAVLDLATFLVPVLFIR